MILRCRSSFEGLVECSDLVAKLCQDICPKWLAVLTDDFRIET